MSNQNENQSKWKIEKSIADNPLQNPVIPTNIKKTSEPLTANTEEFDSTSFSSVRDTIFNKSNIIFLVWFLAIYFIAYFILGFFFKSQNGPSMVSRIFDIVCFVVLVAILLMWYYSSSAGDIQEKGNKYFMNVLDYINESTSIFATGLFLVVFYLFVYILRIPMDSISKPIFIGIVENAGWIVFVITLFVQFLKSVFQISLIDEIKKWWNGLPSEIEKDTKKKEPEPVQIDEVFNISNNLYGYEDAEAICTSYGARLATYDEIEEAYNKGGEWCNYGWSDGQMIFFPTQKSTWDKLQKTKTHKNDCGRPGVNGGYIANPYIKFGVNCFGKKPNASDSELAQMSANKDRVYPKSPEDQALEDKVKFWKDNASKLLQVNSFNTKVWSEFGNTQAAASVKV
jgi:hypothetical protein